MTAHNLQACLNLQSVGGHRPPLQSLNSISFPTSLTPPTQRLAGPAQTDRLESMRYAGHRPTDRAGGSTSMNVWHRSLAVFHPPANLHEYCKQEQQRLPLTDVPVHSSIRSCANCEFETSSCCETFPCRHYRRRGDRPQGTDRPSCLAPSRSLWFLLPPNTESPGASVLFR